MEETLALTSLKKGLKVRKLGFWPKMVATTWPLSATTWHPIETCGKKIKFSGHGDAITMSWPLKFIHWDLDVRTLRHVNQTSSLKTSDTNSSG